ncbi:YkvA family protein [Flammeovirgaceae bacterium SG7u.111]|nr:YkvA family protein [Flammeovirgaceae bacterium SG7u.132]WPO34300.1 YkvA family protein [Flammeovirgaceae bacterium SG7u.111]
MKKIKYEKFVKHYNENTFWKKIKKIASKVGVNVMYMVLLLYYTLQSKELPQKSKALIVGAIGYFLFPFDAVSDLIPMVGYTDDIAALLFALTQVAFYITPEVRFRAKEKLAIWFGEYDEAVLAEVDDKIKKEETS